MIGTAALMGVLVTACQPVTPPIDAAYLSGRVMRAGHPKAPALMAGARAGRLDASNGLRLPGQVVVRFRDARIATRGLHALGLPEGREMGAVRVLEVAPERTDALITQLASDPNVEAVGPNYAYGRLAIPNDPFFAQQKNLELIGLPQAWDVQKGADNIRVTVLDDGYDAAAGDMTGRLLLTPPPRGFWLDTANNDNTPTALPGDWHGTAVASVLGATTNNGVGMAGVTWQGVQIVPVKIYRDTPLPPCASRTSGNPTLPEPRDPGPPTTSSCQSVYDATTATVASALETSVAVGASVINMSFCLLDRVNTNDCATGTDPIIEAMLERAHLSGAVLVGAAGNDNLNQVAYPSSSRWVLAVGSSGTPADPQALVRSEFSNYGPKLDLVAPGQSILTLRAGSVLTASGTSFSSPTVAGVAALLRSNGLESPDVIMARLIETAQDIGAADRDDQTGNGLVRADRALAGPDAALGIPMSITLVDAEGSFVRRVTGSLQSGRNLGAYATENLRGGQYRLEVHLDLNRNGIKDAGDEVGERLVTLNRQRLYGQDVQLKPI
jgi:subtilisin family serine protease